VALALTQRKPGELPAEVTGFVGRRTELAQLASLLETARLVTVTGPGGVGKTRVSLRAAALAAAGYADGVCLVELSALRDAELLPYTVAAALGLPQTDSQLDAVLDFLHDRQLLLILDTCEHLLDVSAMLADAVLRAAPGVTVLATSRQPLDVPGEHTCAIPPLPVPQGDEADGDAVELFAQRAAAVLPGFVVTGNNRADVIRVCRRLDGIPLAIELATVRLRALPLDQLADRLERRFRVLDGGLRTALPRHKTLRTAIEWSHDLCTPTEQALWARLSVFADSFDVAAAEEVCAGGALEGDEIVSALIGLVDKSVLLREEREEKARYRLLDTLREFGAEQLARTGQAAEFQERHITRYRAMAEDFAEHQMDGQLARYRGLSRENDNLRTAFEYALALPGQDGEAVRLIAALMTYWLIRDLTPEAEYWIGKVLDRFPGPTPERAQVLITRGGMFTDGQVDCREGLALAEQLGETQLAARGYLYLNRTLLQFGATDEARRAGAIAEERLSDPFALLCLDAQMAQLHAFGGEPELAIERCQRGLRRAAGSGEVWQTSYLPLMAGYALLQQGRYRESAEALCQALVMKAELDDSGGMALCLEFLGWLAAGTERYDRAAWLLGAARTQIRRQGGDIEIETYDFMTAPHQQAQTAGRSALGENRYGTLFQTGAEYPLDQLVSPAINDADTLPPTQPEQASTDQADPLTTREREIAALVAQGLSNRDIAERLIISKRTVDAHVEHIYTKLGISSRMQLANRLRP
jgi:non-specific serine/threonine protein kinase